MKRLLLFFIFGASLGLSAQTIQTITPNTGNLGQTLQVTITGDGTDFTSVSSSNAVFFYNGGNDYFFDTSVSVISETELQATLTIPTNISTGLYNLSIETTFGGVYTLPNAFNVVDNYNKINGKVRIDVNANGCDASDVQASGVKLKLSGSLADVHTYTNSSGDYTFYVPAGSYTVTPEPNAAIYSAFPGSAPFTFATTNGAISTQDFCLDPIGNYKDLSISILPIVWARPGFDAVYRLVYRNNGNQVVSGSVNFIFDDSRLDFVGSLPAVDVQTVNNLSWSYAALLPSESRIIELTLNVNSPMEIPAVNMGDLLDFEASVTPIAGDDIPNDNVAMFSQTVVNSYDPNDKAVTEGEQINVADVDKYLHYLIRFQNTGTFAAENIRIQDMLSTNLDPSTLEVVSASHPYRTSLSDGNKVEFFFDNIMLPAEEDDEPGSNGYVAFRVKPSNTVVLGSVIENTAEIYFDFNFPIVTNTVSTTVTELGNPSFDVGSDFTLYPNPAKNVLNIGSKASVTVLSVKIFNQLGQLVKVATSQTDSIAVDDLKTGTYYVQIISDTSTSTKKLVKL